MWHRHGDALYSDIKKIGGLPPGEHMRRGYKITTSLKIAAAKPTNASTEKTNRAHHQAFEAQGLRQKGISKNKKYRKQWEHRKVAGAKPGEIVHHIDGNKLNNVAKNLHVFKSSSEHGAAHRSLELIAYALLRQGVVVFDRQTGLYLSVNQST